MLLLAEHTIEGAVLRGSVLETDFASFVAWRDWGFPEAGVLNCFAMGALQASDGAYLLGVMGPQSVNAGRIYFPSGVPDLDDIVGDRLDLARNLRREMIEETGLRPDDYEAADHWVCVRTGLVDRDDEAAPCARAGRAAARAHPRVSGARSEARACRHPDRSRARRSRCDDAAVRDRLSQRDVEPEPMKPAKILKRLRVDDPDRFKLSSIDPADTFGLDLDKSEAKAMLADDIKRLAELAGAPLRARSMVGAGGAAGDGCGRQGRRDQARDERHQSAGLRGAFVQGAERRRTRPRLPVAGRMRLPSRGRIGIFNRSHYEEVLVVRVHQEFLAAPEAARSRWSTKNIWQERFSDIRAFERHLARNGTAVVKFFLHVSKEEQRKRLLDRLEEPGQALEVRTGRHRRAQALGQIHGRLRGR